MIVYAVLIHYEYEGDELITITNDSIYAEEIRDKVNSRRSSARIEQWDVLTGKCIKEY